MAVCRKHLNDPGIREKVRHLYCETLMTAGQVAVAVGITPHTTYQIIKEVLSPDQHSKFKGFKYAVSKKGANNPHFGKRGAETPHFRGDCPDGYGYLTRRLNGRRYFVHQIVAAEMMGISVEQMPDTVIVHHIDGNRTNNEPANLAITTKAGHGHIHNRYKHTPLELELRGLSIPDAIRYLTSR